MPLLREGRVKPLMDRTFRWKGGRRPTDDGEQRNHSGQNVLVVRPWPQRRQETLILLTSMSFYP